MWTKQLVIFGYVKLIKEIFGKFSLSSSLQHNEGNQSDEGGLKKRFLKQPMFLRFGIFISSIYNFVNAIQPIFIVDLFPKPAFAQR